MLDLSAAFDTVNNIILLQRQEESRHNRKSTSYLSNRSQYVRIEESWSRPTNLKCGVPQGPLLWPFLFNIITLPIGNIIGSHGLLFHIYANDNHTCNYISFKPENSDQNLVKLRNGISDLRVWLKKNFLMLNNDMTFCNIWHNTTVCKTRTTAEQTIISCCD